MKRFTQTRLAFALVACAVTSVAFAAGDDYGSGSAAASPGGSVQISAPANGAVIDGQARNRLVFDVHPSPEGNHVHIYIDDHRPDVVHMFKGSFTLPHFSPGKHKICLREATSDHVLTGLAKCITVTAK